MLAEALRNRGMEVLLTREPGGTPGAEAIRSLLLHPPGDGWEVEAEALLFAAARADHVARAIRPALEAGHWVVCDRFLDSSRAYQGGGGSMADSDLRALHRIGSGGLVPDITLLLEAPEDAVAARIARRDGDENEAICRRGARYHAQVATAFRRLAEEEPDRFARIDASGTPGATHRAIMRTLAPLLGQER
jgi:dTMP kinase